MRGVKTRKNCKNSQHSTKREENHEATLPRRPTQCPTQQGPSTWWRRSRGEGAARYIPRRRWSHKTAKTKRRRIRRRKERKPETARKKEKKRNEHCEARTRGRRHSIPVPSGQQQNRAAPPHERWYRDGTRNNPPLPPEAHSAIALCQVRVRPPATATRERV